MDKEQELLKRIENLEKIAEKRKRAKMWKTFAGLSVAFYLIALWAGALHGIVGYAGGVAVAMVFAGLYLYVSLLILSPIITHGIGCAVAIEQLKTELRLLRKNEE